MICFNTEPASERVHRMSPPQFCFTAICARVSAPSYGKAFLSLPFPTPTSGAGSFTASRNSNVNLWPSFSSSARLAEASWADWKKGWSLRYYVSLNFLPVSCFSSLSRFPRVFFFCWYWPLSGGDISMAERLHFPVATKLNMLLLFVMVSILGQILIWLSLIVLE